MSQQGITFHSIETEALAEMSDWTRTEVGGRAGRWLKPSEYHRLIHKERAESWAVLLGALTSLSCAAILLYLFG